MPVLLSELRFPEHQLIVRVEDHGEHHRDAASIEVVPNRPLAGVDRFVTTNGWVVALPDHTAVLICDACLLLLLDLGEDRPYCFEPPRFWGFRAYFSRVRIEAEMLVGELYGVLDLRRPLPPLPWNTLRDHFQPGWGPIRQGRFPSAVDLE